MERKDEKSLHNICRKCGSSKFKDWNKLTSDEKFIAERISPAKFSGEEGKNYRFCARCFDAGEIDKENRA